MEHGKHMMPGKHKDMEKREAIKRRLAKKQKK